MSSKAFSTDPSSLRRFFVAMPGRVTVFPSSFSVDDPFVVNHVRNVLRMRQNDSVLLMDSIEETSYIAVIQELNRKQCHFELISAKPIPPPSLLPYVDLGVAMIREQRWDWLLQKVTELGVRSIHPLETERTVIQHSVSEKKLERWKSVARSAAEQSEGTFLPDIHTPESLVTYCADIPGQCFKIALVARGESRQTLKNFIRGKVNTDKTRCCSYWSRRGLERC